MNVLIIGADKGLGAILPGVIQNSGHNVAAGYYSLDGYKGNTDDDGTNEHYFECKERKRHLPVYYI